MIYEKNGALVRFFNSELVQIEPFGKNGIRVRCSPNGRLSGEMRALLELPTPSAQITVGEDFGELVNGKVRACVIFGKV